MLLHEYSPGDSHNMINFYGHGFGSVFGRLLSKVAAKTASKAALGVARKAGSKIIRSGMRKVIPVAKKTLTSAVNRGVRKAVPVAKKMIRTGVKRAAEGAQSVIADKVRKIEKTAIKKGVPSKLAQMVSSAVADGSRKGLSGLTNLVDNKVPIGTAAAAKKILHRVSVPQKRSLSGYRKAAVSSSGSRRRKAVLKKKKKRGRKNLRTISYRIQNLIDSA